MALVRVDRLKFAYPAGPPALTGVSLRIERGEVVLLLGVSGSGKSTLLPTLEPAAVEVRHQPGERTEQRRISRARDSQQEHHPAALEPERNTGQGPVGCRVGALQ